MPPLPPALTALTVSANPVSIIHGGEIPLTPSRAHGTHRESHALLDHLGLGGVHEGRMGAVGLSSSSSSLGWRR